MRLYVSRLFFAVVTALLAAGSAEAQTADIDCVALVDSVGTRIARAVQEVENNATDFYIRHNGLAIPLRVLNQIIVGSTGAQGGIGHGDIAWFTDANCSSPPLIAVKESVNRTILPASVVVAEQNVFYSDPTSVPQRIEVLSLKHDGIEICSPASPQLIATVPAIAQFELPQYTSPYHLEPEPCSTPEPEQFINGCISKNGTLKIVDDPAGCTSRETPITLLRP